MKELFKKETIIRFILSVLIFFGFTLLGVMKPYHPMSWLLLLAIVLIVNKVYIYNKEYFKSSIIFALIFSFLLVFGKTVYSNMENPNVNIFLEFFGISEILSFICVACFIYLIFINILPKLCGDNMKPDNTKWSSKKLFIGSFITIMLCYLPYFLTYFPGVLSPDSMNEMVIVCNNFAYMNNHNPVIHVLFIALPYKIGFALFGNANVGVAFATFAQMMVMALIFSYTITFLQSRNINKKILLICLFYFALAPIHGYYSVTMWKDVIFSGLMILLIIKIIKICEDIEKLKFRNLITFIIISLATILFRNNAVYMYFILAIIMLIVFRKKFKILFLSFLIVLGSYYTILGPVFDGFHIEKSPSSEYIAIPLQQIGRMAYKDVKFNKYETEMLNNLMGVDNLKKYYYPYCVDSLKFNENYNRDFFDSHKKEFLKLWSGLVIKHPVVALEAYATSTLGYWYPGVDYWAVYKELYSNNLGIERDPKAPLLIQKVVDRLDRKDIPLVNMTQNSSLSFWLLSIFAYICAKKKEKKYLVAFIPILGIWITMMIASPVFAEFRYIYSSYTCLPLLLTLPFISKKKNN